MISTESRNGLSDELKTIERRIKRASTGAEIRQTLVMLNTINLELDTTDSMMRATYYFLRGVVYTKGALMRHGGWVASSVESLQYAIELFVNADAVVKNLAAQHGWSRELLYLRQLSAYEAMVAATTLIAWGTVPEILPDTSCLTSDEQRRIARHQRHRHLLRSRY